MCSPLTQRLLSALALLACGLPSLALGQSAGEYRARIEELLPIWRDAVESERAARPWIEPETLRIGTVTIVANPRGIDFVRAAAESAWEHLRLRLQSDSLLLLGDTLIVRLSSRAQRERWPAGRGVIVEYGAEDDPETVAGLIVGAYGRRLAAGLDAGTTQSLAQRLPLKPMSREQLERVYLELATTDSRVTRLCLQGDRRSCVDALAITEHEDPITVWYGPDERRRLVDRLERPRRYRRGSNPRADECLARGNDAACLEFLRAKAVSTLRPLSGTARRALVSVALEIGGDGAYSRFLNADARTIEERVVRAAGVVSDSVVSAWREAILASRPKPASLPGWLVFSALLWAGILATLASRSSRWR